MNTENQNSPAAAAQTANADTDQSFEKELQQALQASAAMQQKKKFFTKKKLFLLLVIVIVAAVAVAVLSGGSETGFAASTQPLAKGDIAQTVTLTGPVEGTDSAEVVSNIHSEITAINVKEGDHVEQGQIIATLDSSELEKAYLLAKATYDNAVEAQRAANAQATQDYNTAKTNYERQKYLYDEGAISAADLETAKNTLDNATRVKNTDAHATAVDNALYDLQQKQHDMENAQIKAPISGTVTRVNAKLGRFADDMEDNVPLFVVENLDDLSMEIKVSEYTIGKVQLGQQVIISADILNGATANGEVAAISPTGEEKGGGSTERVIPITIRITDRNTKLIAGITAKAKVILAEAADVFCVPQSAIIQNADGSTCIAIAENGRVKTVNVICGIESDTDVAIEAADGYTLEEGVMLITNPQPQMTDGMPVTVRQMPE